MHINWSNVLIDMVFYCAFYFFGWWMCHRGKAREFAEIILHAEDEGFITVHETPAEREANRTRVELTVAGKVHTMLFPLKGTPQRRHGRKHHIRPRHRRHLN